jgi:hypothetical protein
MLRRFISGLSRILPDRLTDKRLSELRISGSAAFFHPVSSSVDVSRVFSLLRVPVIAFVVLRLSGTSLARFVNMPTVNARRDGRPPAAQETRTFRDRE